MAHPMLKTLAYTIIYGMHKETKHTSKGTQTAFQNDHMHGYMGAAKDRGPILNPRQ